MCLLKKGIAKNTVSGQLLREEVLAVRYAEWIQSQVLRMGLSAGEIKDKNQGISRTGA